MVSIFLIKNLPTKSEAEVSSLQETLTSGRLSLSAMAETNCDLPQPVGPLIIKGNFFSKQSLKTSASLPISLNLV